MSSGTSMKYVTIVVALIFTTMAFIAEGATEVKDMRTEYKKDPLGIHTKKPRFSWKITSDVAEQEQTAYQILVASSPRLLSPNRADLWNSQRVTSDQSILVDYNGNELGSKQKCWWMVRIWDKNGRASRWSQPAYFEIGMLNPGDWEAQWIKTAIEFEQYDYPSPHLRKEFSLTKPVQSARLYCTSKGLYEFYINGEKVGDEVLTPGYTSFQKRLQYQVFDVTAMLRRGANATGVILANGWYRGFNPNNRAKPDIQDLEVLAQIEVTFTDGSTMVIPTDASWKSSTGPIVTSEILDGEVYDARLELPGWATAGYNDSNWKGTKVTQSTKNTVVGSISEPIRKIEEIRPVEVIRTPEGDIVLDMGQNMVGWCRLKVKAPAGTTITLRHAEVLDQKGNFYTTNLRRARQEVTYICKGTGSDEIFEPRFTFQGFRYVAIAGYPGEVTPDVITGVVVHSDLEMTGTFSCNNELINKLQQNIIWGQKGNFLDVPTDCPQRDERLGWTGDIQVFAPTACYIMNSAAFLTKWLKDLAADQREDGQVPHVVPDDFGRAGATGWSDAALIVPWNVYLNYGDRRILEEQYESMKGWVEFMRKDASEDNLWRPKTNQYGDWLAFATTRSDYPGATTDKDMLANAYFYHSAGLLRKSAEILGKTADVKSYTDLQAKVKEAFNKEFVTPNGRLSSNTQTAYVVALSFGLLPPHLEKVAAERLANDVNVFGHITTGFLGTADICHVLTKYGYINEAYKLLYREQYPSWLYPVTKGATTIWERWDGIKPDGSFQNPGMNSFNHYAYGAVGDWLYKVVAGINPSPENPGYKNIMIKPRPWGEMNNVKATHESPYGTVGTEWTIENGILRLMVQIPVNTRADIYIPTSDRSLKIDGREQKGVQLTDEGNLPYQFIRLSRGSGQYVFETRLSLGNN
jgi:alpha-L-rhamnosidase